MLKNFKPGSDITVLDTRYTRITKDENGDWFDDTMTIVYKDNLTGLKYTETIHKPKYTFYMANDDIEIPEHMFFIEKDKVHPVTVRYNDIKKTIAELTDNMEFYKNNQYGDNRRLNDMLHFHPRVFRSDMNIEDYYRFEFNKLYKNTPFTPTKAFFDIEVDGKHARGDFPKYDDSPVNAICLIDMNHNMVYSFLLRMPDSPSMVEFEKTIGPDKIDALKSLIISKVGEKKYIKYGLDKLQYNVLFYDDEITLIQEAFMAINVLKPDFLMAWNMSFDIPFIIDRLNFLGINPCDIMCHPDFEIKECYYMVDVRNYDTYAERGDYARISSYTVFLDQMIQFASRRKGRAAFKSFKLDDIGKQVAGVGKVDYHHICNNLVDLPYKDYMTFWMYNVLDVINQVCIESETNDIDYIFGKCLSNNTRYSKGHRQTVYLSNRAAKSFDNMGFIIGNNINKLNPKPDKKFKGAYVASPSLVDDEPKIKLHGQPIDVYDNLDDFDYQRLYPTMLQEFNMAPNTQIGKIFIPNEIHDKENMFGDPRYDRGGAFIEDLQSHCYLEFGSRWLHLADYATLIEDVKEYFYTIASPSGPIEMDSEGRVSPLLPYNGPITPLISTENRVSPLIRFVKPDIEPVKQYLDNKRILQKGI